MFHFLIADDHLVMRQAIIQIIRDDWPDAIFGEAADGSELVSKAADAPWNVIISDITMPLLSGIEALPLLKKIAPDTPVLLTSINGETSYALKALRSGAAGFIPKTVIQVELVKAMLTVMSGKKYLTGEQAIQLGGL
ncbi:MAG TPA: response regulator transcription factor [Puia sp.]|nr:response regulator transcription factor [Puia sp.]